MLSVGKPACCFVRENLSSLALKVITSSWIKVAVASASRDEIPRTFNLLPSGGRFLFNATGLEAV